MGCNRYWDDPALDGRIPLDETGLNKPFPFCFIHKLSTVMAYNCLKMHEIYTEETGDFRLTKRLRGCMMALVPRGSKDSEPSGK